MGNFHKVKLEKLITIKHGYAFKGEYFVNHFTKDIVLTPGNFAIGGGFQSNKHKYYEGPVPKEYVLNDGDLIVTMTDLSKDGDTLGYPALIPKNSGFNWLHNQRIGLIKSRGDNLNLLFLFYLMRTRPYQKFVVGSASGSTVKHTSPKRIFEYEANIPDIKTQTRIASVLSAYDDLIENNEKRIKVLEEMTQLLYTEWFVRFKFPGYEKSRMVESGTEFGVVPEGWEMKSITDSFEITGGGTPSRVVPEYWGGGINWYTPTDLTRGNQMFTDSSSEKITETGMAKSSAKLFPPFCVMMTSRATIGAISINTLPATTNQGFITCVPNEKVTLYYLYYWTKQHVPLFIDLGSGATFKEISRGNFKKIKILIPTAGVLQQFENKLKPVGELILGLQRKNRNLIKTRDILIPELVTGKRGVKS